MSPCGTMGDPSCYPPWAPRNPRNSSSYENCARPSHGYRSPRTCAKLERRELHRHIVENDSGLLLHPITDLLYGSLDNLFMIEWQARKLDRAPADRVGFIGRTRLPAVLAQGEISDRDQPSDLHLGCRLQPHHVQPVRGTGLENQTTELFQLDTLQAGRIIQYPSDGVI